MGEVQLRSRIWSGSSVAFVDLVDGDTKGWMVVRGTAVVEIVGVRGSSNACSGQDS